MKPFRFALDSVLEARRAQENEARLQLAMALEKQQQALALSREAARTLSLFLQAIAAASTDRFSSADRDRSWSMRAAQEKLCTQLRNAAHECGSVVEEKRNAAMLARRNRELLEKLKESQRADWQKEAGRLEQLQLDEFAMTRRYQAALQEAAVC